MGFSELRAEEACIKTAYTSLECAVDWLDVHSEAAPSTDNFTQVSSSHVFRSKLPIDDNEVGTEFKYGDKEFYASGTGGSDHSIHRSSKIADDEDQGFACPVRVKGRSSTNVMARRAAALWRKNVLYTTFNYWWYFSQSLDYCTVCATGDVQPRGFDCRYCRATFSDRNSTAD